MPADEDGVDRFEIKVNFAAAQIDKAMEVFGIDPAAAKQRRIWFGEVVSGRDGRGALPLLERGVILRVRAKAHSGDVTVKLRGPDGCLDVAAWRARTQGLDAKVEGDWAARHLVSASLDATFEASVPNGSAPAPATVLSTAQKALARDLLVPLDQVELLGPIDARKWDPDGDDGVAAELWTVDDLRFLEVSVVTEDDPEKAQEQLRGRARDAGLTLDEGQDPKTTIVLRRLAGA
jgi:hypothetical protein